MAKPKWKNTTVRLGDLKPWMDNPRLSTKVQAERIIKSFEKFGQVITVAVDPDFEVLDGHQRLGALLTLHGEDYQIEARQSDRKLSEEERLDLAVSLHAGATGSWDWQKLSSFPAPKLIEMGFDTDKLKDWNNNANNLKELLNSEQVEPVDAEPQIDHAAELAIKWNTASGQLWKLGNHRLLIGDCTVRENVERLMGGERAVLLHADPPYNTGETWGGLQEYRGNVQVENDNRKDWREWIKAGGEVWRDYALSNDCSCYLWFGSIQPPRDIFESIGFDMRGQIAWVKEHYNIGRGDYHSQYELCLYFSIGKRFWCGRRDLSDVWNAKRIEQTREHPNQKPLSLTQDILQNSSEVDSLVFEPFAGSGTTIIAAHNLNRRCYAMEISEKYGAVILERFYTATGITPELVTE